MIYYNEWTALHERAEHAEAELERVKKVCAEMRALLEDHKNCWVKTSSCIPDGRGIHQPVHYDTSRRIREFLESSDTGRDYVHKSEVEKRDVVIKEMREALKGVINSAVHPDVAIRSVMVPLDPIRNALARAKEEGL